MGKVKSIFNALVYKYLNNKESAEERETLEQYYELFKEEPDGIAGLSSQQVQLLEERLLMKTKAKLELSKHHRINFFFGKTSIISAAAVLIFIFVSLILVKSNLSNKDPKNSAVSIINPGGNKATLTLANGKELDLSTFGDDQSINVDGITITKKPNGLVVYQALPKMIGSGVYSNAVHVLKTPKGGKYQVVLPDGSKVWLNAASVLTFPIDYHKNSRGVELRGEAYFEVAKINHLPFTVKTNLQLIEVLGTHFNVNSYPFQEAKTTLYEGSIKVFGINSVSKIKTKNYRLLKPGEELTVAATGSVLQMAPLRTNLAWKNDLFVFENEKIKHIMDAVSRWYDVDVVYEGKITEETFNMEMPRSTDIKEVLENLELTSLVHFKIEGRRLTVMP